MKNLYLIRVAAALLLVLSFSFYLHAQTNISGSVGGVWTPAGNPYMIVGDTYVPADSSLLIEAGVSVQFTGEFVLEVTGNIQAIGTEQIGIELKSTSTYSKGLHIINGKDTCSFGYCTFKDFKEQTDMGGGNFSGGALHASNTMLEFNGCTFMNNSISLSTSLTSEINACGGAVSLDTCTCGIRNSSFTNNKILMDVYACDGNDPIAKGGAIYCSGDVRIQNCIISTNEIEISSDDLWSSYGLGLGGGIYASDNVRVQNCNINTNSITISSGVFDGGAGSCAEGGGVWTTGIVEYCTVNYNKCITVSSADGEMSGAGAGGYSYGGGIYGGSLLLSNHVHGNKCQSSGNAYGGMGSSGSGQGESHGGGVYGATIVRQSIISSNNCTSNAAGGGSWGYGGGTAESFGGGLFDISQCIDNLIYSNSCISHATGDGYGNASSWGCGTMNSIVENSTVVSNSLSASGTTPSCKGSGVHEGEVYNSIIYSNNTAPQASEAYVAYSCVEGGCWGPGNISDNPLFVTGPEGDYYLSQTAAGQTQQSPCVDAGNPDTHTYLGTTRTDTVPDLGIIDMGYHYPAQFGFTGVSSHQTSDFNITQIIGDPLGDHLTLLLQMPVKDRVTLRIYNLLGQQVAVYDDTFDSGKHLLSFYPGNESCYLLSATACGTQKSIKLIGGGGSGPCRITGP